MSIDAPSTPDASIGSLPEPRLEDRHGPEPVAHGAAVQAVFNDVDRELSVYSAVHQLWYEVVGDRDEEPGIVAELDERDHEWLDAPTPGREWVVKLTSSRWKAGTGTGDDYSAYYKYDLTLRERDEDGDLYKTGRACSLRVLPQFADLNYKDGSNLTLQYGEGSLVRCSTTWADEAEEVEGRMFDLLEAALNVDRGRLLADRDQESRRIQKAEAHHRFDIGWKRQVVETLDRTRELIAYGGMSEIDAHQKRQREGYLEALVDADRWHLLGFERTRFDIELKCYQAAGWAEIPREDPAHHPKLEASFAGVDGDGALPHVDEWGEVMSTLRTVVSSHLDWSGVGREELVADDFQDGPGLPEYRYPHPAGRREQLRERFEAVSTEVYREALKANTQAVYDILTVIATESGASYDMLEERTGLARSTIRYHVSRLAEIGVCEKISNPVLVVFPSPAALESSKEILRRIYPDDQIENMMERAEERRERREERDDPSSVGDDDQDADDLEDSDDAGDDDRSRNSEWEYFEDLRLEAHQLANALEKEYLDGDEVRVRTDRRSWVE
ncbi:winged helix-turn-helix domain-containing protein [Halorubrum sp. ASP1]|uniref:winged helix-turn-helix domain-containing protein n=1 Tax=Halorubrum sp. ASP1 TaxID=2518114 RepID=UPI0010F96ED8|nr:winged helix-turn-helix domain-containing protein [Halorubrum sp. ASP1]TKX57448.1 winged helix-turn-helix domain-containing protein [Halorubrum sp. ASP1]